MSSESNDRRMKAWPFVELEAEREAAEATGSALIDAGSTGVEEQDLPNGRVRLVAYFGEAPDLGELARALARAPGLDPAALSTMRAGSTPDDDWLRIWKRGFEPLLIGERLLILPSWQRERAREFPGRAVVEIDPGMAFGTGTHETTRLCLEWLEREWCGGSLLDVGTGTGILAIAAALLDSRAGVTAIDVDPLAVEIARANAEINGVTGRISIRACGPDGVSGRSDTVLANLTADVILASREALVARVRPGGFLVLSGILLEQGREIVETFDREEFLVKWRREAGEWVALSLRAPAAR
jgi:ribosomal protein L11 methyltransferase